MPCGKRRQPVRSMILQVLGLVAACCLVSCQGTGDTSTGVHSSSKSITAYSFLSLPGVGTISESDKTISIKVPYGTDVAELVAVFSITGASVNVDEIVQVSGTTANDFTNPVTYTVTAADDSEAVYLVTVTTGTVPERAWVQRYSYTPSEVDWDEPTAMAVDAAGNVYVTGGGTGYGYATIKYDANGNQLWLQHFGGWDWARSIAVDTSGNVYVTSQPATIKYSASGTPVWIKNHDFYDIHGIDLKIDNYDDIYVTGWKRNSEGTSDAVTIKYDGDGNELWERLHHETGKYGLFKSLIVDSSGNVYAAGYSGAADGSDYQYIVVKYDVHGEELWTRRLCGAPAIVTSENISLAIDSQGDLYLGAGIVEPNLGIYSSDFVLVKYDKKGKKLWLSRYDGPDKCLDYISGIARDSHDDIIVTGSSLGATTGWDYATIKYDKDGNQLWVQRFDSDTDAANAIAVDKLDNVYVTGGIWGPLGYATVKYDADGNQSWTAYYGGPADAEGWATAIVVDTAGSVYVTGYSMGAGTNYDFATIKYTQ